jgi:hypothetical protein
VLQCDVFLKVIPPGRGFRGFPADPVILYIVVVAISCCLLLDGAEWNRNQDYRAENGLVGQALRAGLLRVALRAHGVRES